MIQDANPLTGNTNVKIVECDGGHVAFDTDSGLLFGSVQLPASIDPDRLYASLVGGERPDAWREELRAVVDARDEAPDFVSDTLYDGAVDVLDPQSPASVLVTLVNAPSAARRMGRPDSVDIGLLRMHGRPIEDAQPPAGSSPLAPGIKIGGLPLTHTLDEDARAAAAEGAQGQNEAAAEGARAAAAPPARRSAKAADATPPESTPPESTPALSEADAPANQAPNATPEFATDADGATTDADGAAKE